LIFVAVSVLLGWCFENQKHQVYIVLKGINIKFLVNMEKNSSDSYKMAQKFYGKGTVSRRQVSI
jgi:hypothetical protein